MAPTTQKVLGVPASGAPWKIYDNWPVPKPGPNDVLLKVVAAGLNPADWKIQSGAPGPLVSQWPFIGGLEAAGIIEEVGAEVTNFAKGDKVFCPGGFDQVHAAYKQYTIAPALNVAKIPHNISFEQAASIPVCLGVVATGMWSKAPGADSVGFPAPWEEGGLSKFKGQAALVVGGSSSVGQYEPAAIQMAKLQGFSPIIATSSLKHADWLKSLGATHVLDRSMTSTAILAELPKLTGGKPIVFAYDAISEADTQNLAYDALAAGGSMVVTLPMSGYPRGEGTARWLTAHLVQPNRVEILPNGLAGIPEGLERSKNNKVSGVKLIARPQETV
ncbi:GroES-like protein [Lentinus tigrinus ALCF2SS1-6]|uniref:GroES-like protein n=1 Tax=Lentinus tigrinus ALCF2SS1-6 TaxID=1328759 RepID=A0A5C2S784_9APHY|nr:GroES-like protein [Lentinus tigrinus ALCF2SS1-6]